MLAQGDQHTDDPGHIERAFDGFLEALAEAPEGSGGLMLGDPFSFANTRSQKALRKAFPEATEDAQESIDGFVQQMARPLRKRLEPVKERLWGMVEGNHGWMFKDGTTVDERLAEQLGVPYADGMMVLSLSLMRPGSNSVAAFNIVCHHGATAAQTASGDLNSLIKHSGYFANAHIVMEGHTHGLSVTPDERLVITGSEASPLRHQVCWVARCGSAVQGMRTGKAGYPERRMLKPTMPGHVEFDVWLEREKSGGRDVLHACSLGRAVPLQGVSVGVAG